VWPVSTPDRVYFFDSALVWGSLQLWLYRIAFLSEYIGEFAPLEAPKQVSSKGE
jgi:hypothetical protein